MWEKVKLGKITNNLDSRRKPLNQIQRDKIKGEGKYPYIGANNIQDYIDQYIFDSKILCVSEDGGSWGANEICAKIYNEKCWVNNHAHVLTSQEDELLLEYLMYYLNYADLNMFINGATRGKLTKKTLESIEIPLPPLPIQEKIASILDKADELRRKDKDLQVKYDELAQAIFIDMFGDPVKNEKGWEVKMLHDLGAVDRGVSKHRPRNAPELLNGLYPLIQTGDVANSGGWISKHKSTYSEIGLKQSKMWPSGTLCITIAANIAKTGILTFDACFPDSVVGFISNSLSNEVFIQYWFSFFQKILEDQAPESAQKNINLAILRSLEIITPPIHLQEAFAKKIELINQLKAQTNAEKSEELFQSLLQKAFKGELVS